MQLRIFTEPQQGASYDQLLAVARATEANGFDAFFRSDHLMRMGAGDGRPGPTESWVTLGGLARETSRIRLGTLVTSATFRLPGLLAIAVAQVDAMSGGRVELGLGAGAFWEAIEAMGGPRRSPGEAVRSVEEAIQVMRLVWSEERSVRFDGEIYALKGLKPGPHPAHEIGIWVGAGGPRMLDLIGRLADGWVPSMGWATPDRLPEMHRRIDEGAARAGRDPGEIRRAYNISGMIGEEADAPLVGPPSMWVEQLSRFALELGMDTFVYWPADDPVRQAELFASEVVPAVRETVAAARS